MKLIAIYIALVIVGELIAYAIGRGIESFSDNLGLTIFLLLFFSVFAFGWKLAVRITA